MSNTKVYTSCWLLNPICEIQAYRVLAHRHCWVGHSTRPRLFLSLHLCNVSHYQAFQILNLASSPKCGLSENLNFLFYILNISIFSQTYFCQNIMFDILVCQNLAGSDMDTFMKMNSSRINSQSCKLGTLHKNSIWKNTLHKYTL